MRTRSAKYWTERASELEAEVQSDAAAVQKRIIDTYKRAIRNIQDDIEDVFSSFLKLEELDPAEGRALISAAQAKEQYEELKALLDEVTDEAERRSIRRRINAQAYGARMSRLEALKERVYNELTAAAAAAEKEGTEFFGTVYQKSYYSTIYNTAKGLDAGVDFAVLNKRAINAAAAEKWSGLNYSDRVWKNNKQFVSAVQRVITDGIAAGHSPYRMAEQLGSYARAEDGKSIQYVTERLTRTEAAHFLTAGQLEAYKDIGAKEYRYMAALSERTCEVCGSLDGSVFRTSDAVPGKNYPPIHPRCRCTTIIGDFIPNSRRAQDPLTGKGYKVDGSVTFEEWRDGLSPEQREAMETHVAEIKKDIDNGRKNDIIGLNRNIKRREVNIGTFKNLQVPMQKRSVLRIAEKYNVSTDGLTFKIQRSEKFLALPFYGSTDYNNIGRIDLFPNAFSSEEELIKTVIHEKCHVKQLKKYGKKYAQENLDLMEQQAYRFESLYYNILKKRVGK